jgi:hypothetical protein
MALGRVRSRSQVQCRPDATPDGLDLVRKARSPTSEPRLLPTTPETQLVLK